MPDSILRTLYISTRNLRTVVKDAGRAKHIATILAKHGWNRFFEKRRSVIIRMNTNFLKHSAQEPYKLEAKEVEHCEKMLHCLQERYGYNIDSARSAVAFLMKNRYEGENDRKIV